MADLADQADDLIQAEVEEGVRRARGSGPFANLRPTGFCHWCGEPTPTGRTHCAPSVDSCHEDHLKKLRFDR